MCGALIMVGPIKAKQQSHISSWTFLRILHSAIKSVGMFLLFIVKRLLIIIIKWFDICDTRFKVFSTNCN